MELATGTLPVQAPKALPNDAWGEFLQRVLVSANHPETPMRAASETAPRDATASERGEGAATEQ